MSIQEIEAMTERCGGTLKPFSQSDQNIAGARKGDSRTTQGQIVQALYTNDKAPSDPGRLYVGGMCHAMSLYWILGTEGKIGAGNTSFIDWIYPRGRQGARSAVNLDAVGVLVQKTVQYKNGISKGATNLADPKTAKAARQKMGYASDDEFLKYRGFTYHQAHNGWNDIKNAIAKIRSGVFLISYHGEDGGHACAAATGILDKDPVVYFDPNYGEATIPIKHWFAWWTMYRTLSGYGTKYNSQVAYEYYS